MKQKDKTCLTVSKSVFYQDIIIVSFLTAICAFSIYFAADIFEPLEFDSGEYLEFSPNRTAIFPLIIKFTTTLSGDELTLIYMQPFLYLCSFCYLLWTIQRLWGSKLTTVLLGLATGLNIYLQAYHTVILTESLGFTVCNLLTALLITGMHRWTAYRVFVFGIFVGFLVTLRPAFISFLPACFVITLLFALRHQEKILKNGLIFSTAVFLIVCAEYVGYHHHHQERQSHSELFLAGKAGILTTDPDFKFPNINKDDADWLAQLDTLLNPYQEYLEEESNVFVKTNLRSNFEVFAQQVAPRILYKQNNESDEDEERLKRIGFATIFHNWQLYLQSSAQHLFGLWLVQELHFFSIVSDLNLPTFESEELNGALPGFHQTSSTSQLFDPNSNKGIALFSLVSFPAFLMMGFSSLVFGIWSLAKISFDLFNEKFSSCSGEVLLTGALFLIGWSNLIFVAFTNIATPRYLMPTFGIFVLGNLIFLNALVNQVGRKLSEGYKKTGP